MNVGSIGFYDFYIASPTDGIKTIQNDLLKNKFVVVKDKNIFKGILTLTDTVYKNHNLVIDCLTKKPHIDYNTAIKDSISLFEKNSIHVLPIFKHNKFHSVLRYKDVLDFTFQQAEKLKEYKFILNKYEALKKLSFGCAHDFNNILSCAMGHLDLLFEENKADLKLRKKIKLIKDGLCRGQDFTTQLLLFSKDNITNKKRCNINKFIKDHVPFYNQNLKVKIQYNFSNKILPIYIEQNQFCHVLINLTLNAVHSMQNGGILLFSTKNTIISDNNELNLKAGKYVKISVKDTGKGIDNDILPNIFEPYVTNKPEGNGLGLAIVHSIIINHGGTIVVNSSSETGTEFVIYLPTN